MAELFSPVWIIERQEITDLEKYNKWDFKNSISTTIVKEFTGGLSEVKQEVKDLMATEPVGLKFAIPPRVKYQYKLKH